MFRQDVARAFFPEQFNMTPQSDHSMFDFDELDNIEEREVHRPVHEREYRCEDAIERFRLAERRIVQEAVMSIEGNEVDGEDESDGDCPGGEVSETEHETSTNALCRPGCRADKVRIRNMARRRQQPHRVPSSAWLEPEEETAPIREDASRVVLSPADEAGVAETQEEEPVDRPIMIAGRPTTKKPQMRITGARSDGGRRLRMARGINVDSGVVDPVMPRRMVRGLGNQIRLSKVSEAGVHYALATASRIKHEGETDLHFDA